MNHLAEDEKRAFEALERDLNHELGEDSYPTDPDETLSFEHFIPNAGAWKIKVREQPAPFLFLLTDTCPRSDP